MDENKPVKVKRFKNEPRSTCPACGKRPVNYKCQSCGKIQCVQCYRWYAPDETTCKKCGFPLVC
jgi:predicted nucleic acid-binding Zn ribbon protein